MTAKIKTISYAELVASLLAQLPDREREVLQKRNALSAFPKHTLEKIGNDFNITRERVRQIEKDGLKKLKSLDYAKLKLPVSDLEKIILDYLNTYGGVMSEDHLIDILLNQETDEEKNSLDFVLANILGQDIERVRGVSDHYIIWKLPKTNLDQVLDVASALHEIIDGHGQPLRVEDLLDKFQSHKHYKTVSEMEAEIDSIIEALLRLRKDLNSNILGQWGKSHWTTIRPKRMTDKAYLIMLRENKPLHFADVAELINQAGFDRKKAHPSTVHNELILDDKYVLVGRGIYALRDWGYQEGTVNDIITQILNEKGPLVKKDLVEEVLKQRLVQKTTITLALMDKNKFARTEDGKYKLV